MRKISFDETIHQKFLKNSREAGRWPPNVPYAWDRCQPRMHELMKAWPTLREGKRQLN